MFFLFTNILNINFILQAQFNLIHNHIPIKNKNLLPTNHSNSSDLSDSFDSSDHFINNDTQENQNNKKLVEQSNKKFTNIIKKGQTINSGEFVSNNTIIEKGVMIKNGTIFENDIFFQDNIKNIIFKSKILYFPENSTNTQIITGEKFTVRPGILIPNVDGNVIDDQTIYNSDKTLIATVHNNMIIPNNTIIKKNVLIQSGVIFEQGVKIESGIYFDFNVYYLSKDTDYFNINNSTYNVPYNVILNKVLHPNQLNNIFQNGVYQFSEATLIQEGFIFTQGINFILSKDTLINFNNKSSNQFGIEKIDKIPILIIPKNSIVKNGITIPKNSVIETNVTLEAGVNIEKGVITNFNLYYVTNTNFNQTNLNKVQKIYQLNSIIENININKNLSTFPETFQIYGKITTGLNILLSSSNMINIPLLSGITLPEMTVLGDISDHTKNNCVIPPNVIFAPNITIEKGTQVSTKQKLSNNPYFQSTNFKNGIKWFDPIYSDNTNYITINNGKTIGGTTIGGTITGGAIVQHTTTGGNIISGKIPNILINKNNTQNQPIIQNNITNLQIKNCTSKNVVILGATITNGTTTGGITYNNQGNNDTLSQVKIKWGTTSQGKTNCITQTSDTTKLKTTNVNISDSYITNGNLNTGTITDATIDQVILQNVVLQNKLNKQTIKINNINQISITSANITVNNNSVTISSGDIILNKTSLGAEEQKHKEIQAIIGIKLSIISGTILSSGNISKGTINTDSTISGGQLSNNIGKKTGGMTLNGVTIGGQTTGGILDNNNYYSIVDNITHDGITYGGTLHTNDNTQSFKCQSGLITKGNITEGKIVSNFIFNADINDTSINNCIVNNASMVNGTTINGITKGGTIKENNIPNQSTIINGITVNGTTTGIISNVDIIDGKITNGYIQYCHIKNATIHNAEITNISLHSNKENILKNITITNCDIIFDNIIGYKITKGNIVYDKSTLNLNNSIIISGQIKSGQIVTAQLIDGDITGHTENGIINKGITSGGITSGGKINQNNITYTETPIQSEDTILKKSSVSDISSIKQTNLNNSEYIALQINNVTEPINIIHSGVTLPKNLTIEAGIILNGYNNILLNNFYYLQNANLNIINQVNNFFVNGKVKFHTDIQLQENILLTHPDNTTITQDVVVYDSLNNKKTQGILPSDMIILGGTLLHKGLILKKGLQINKNVLVNFPLYYFKNSTTIQQCFNNLSNDIIHDDIQIAYDILTENNILLPTCSVNTTNQDIIFHIDENTIVINSKHYDISNLIEKKASQKIQFNIFDFLFFFPPINNTNLSNNSDKFCYLTIKYNILQKNGTKIEKIKFYPGTTISAGIKVRNCDLSGTNISSDANVTSITKNSCLLDGANIFGLYNANQDWFKQNTQALEGIILSGDINQIINGDDTTNEIQQNTTSTGTKNTTTSTTNNHQNKKLKNNIHLQSNSIINMSDTTDLNSLIVGENIGWSGYISEHNQGFLKPNDFVQKKSFITGTMLNKQIYTLASVQYTLITHNIAKNFTANKLISSGIIENDVIISQGIIQKNTADLVVSTQNVAIFNQKTQFDFVVYYLDQSTNTIRALPPNTPIDTIYSHISTKKKQHNEVTYSLISYDETYLCPYILLIQPTVGSNIINQPVINQFTKYQKTSSIGKKEINDDDFVIIGNKLDHTIPFIIPSGFKISKNMIIMPDANIQGNIQIDNNCIIVVNQINIDTIENSSIYINPNLSPEDKKSRQTNLGYFFYNAGTSIPKGSTIGNVYWIGDIHKKLPILSNDIIGLSYQYSNLQTNQQDENYSFFNTISDIKENTQTNNLNHFNQSVIQNLPKNTQITAGTIIPKNCIVQSNTDHIVTFQKESSFEDGAIVSINSNGLENIRSVINNSITHGGITFGGILVGGNIQLGNAKSGNIYNSSNSQIIAGTTTGGIINKTTNTISNAITYNATLRDVTISDIKLTDVIIQNSTILNGVTSGGTTTGGITTNGINNIANITNGITNGGITMYGITYCAAMDNIVITNATINNVTINNSEVINTNTKKKSVSGGTVISGNITTGTIISGKITVPIKLKVINNSTNQTHNHTKTKEKIIYINFDIKDNIKNNTKQKFGIILTNGVIKNTNYKKPSVQPNIQYTHLVTKINNNKFNNTKITKNITNGPYIEFITNTVTNANNNYISNETNVINTNNNISWIGEFSENSNQYLISGDTIGPFQNSASIVSKNVVFPEKITLNYINLSNTNGPTIFANSQISANTNIFLDQTSGNYMYVIISKKSEENIQNSSILTFLKKIEKICINRVILEGFINVNIPLDNNPLIGNKSTIIINSNSSNSPFFAKKLTSSINKADVYWSGTKITQDYQDAINNSSHNSTIGNQDGSSLMLETMTIKHKNITKNVTISSNSILEDCNIAPGVLVSDSVTFKRCHLAGIKIKSKCVLDDCYLGVNITIQTGVIINTNCDISNGFIRDNNGNISILWFGVFDSSISQTILNHISVSQSISDNIINDGPYQTKVNFEFARSNTNKMWYKILSNRTSKNQGITWIGNKISGQKIYSNKSPIISGDYIDGTVIVDPDSIYYNTITGKKAITEADIQSTVLSKNNDKSKTNNTKIQQVLTPQMTWGLPPKIKYTNLPNGIVIKNDSVIPIEFIQESFNRNKSTLTRNNIQGNVTWYGQYIYQFMNNRLMKGNDKIWGRIVMYPIAQASSHAYNIINTFIYEIFGSTYNQHFQIEQIHQQFSTGITESVQILPGSQIPVQFFIDNTNSLYSNHIVVYGTASNQTYDDKINNKQNLFLDYYEQILQELMPYLKNTSSDIYNQSILFSIENIDSHNISNFAVIAPLAPISNYPVKFFGCQCLAPPKLSYPTNASFFYSNILLFNTLGWTNGMSHEDIGDMLYDTYPNIYTYVPKLKHNNYNKYSNYIEQVFGLSKLNPLIEKTKKKIFKDPGGSFFIPNNSFSNIDNNKFVKNCLVIFSESRTSKYGFSVKKVKPYAQFTSLDLYNQQDALNQSNEEGIIKDFSIWLG